VWFADAPGFNMNFVFGGRKIDAITLDPQRQFPDTVLEDDYWLRNAARR
jgi:hypothetical protein